MISLEATGFWADNPTNQSAGLGAEASRQIGVIPKISSFISDKGVKSSGGSEERRYRSESGTLTGLENTSRKVRLERELIILITRRILNRMHFIF